MKQRDLYSYTFKKEELQKDLTKVQHPDLKKKFKNALKLTDKCFDTYSKFYDAFKIVLDILIENYSEQENAFQVNLKKSVGNFNTLIEMEKKRQDNYKDEQSFLPVIDNILNYNKIVNESLVLHDKLINKLIENRTSVRKIADDQGKILKAILEITVEVLFLYIYRTNISNINKNVISEYLMFSLGLVPLIGPYISGFNALLNSMKSRAAKIRAADDVLTYIESYSEICEIWIIITNEYIKFLKKWKKVLHKN